MSWLDLRQKVSLRNKQAGRKWLVSIPTSNPDIERYVNSELDSSLADEQLIFGDNGTVSAI